MKSLILSCLVAWVLSMGVFTVLLFGLQPIIGDTSILIAAMASVIVILVTDKVIRYGE